MKVLGKLPLKKAKTPCDCPADVTYVTKDIIKIRRGMPEMVKASRQVVHVHNGLVSWHWFDQNRNLIHA